jgi:hypothetical protein
MIKNNKDGFPHHLRGRYTIHAFAFVEASPIALSPYLYVFYKFK